MTEPLDEARFAALAEAYGADLRRWPDGEREAGRDLAARSQAAARRLAEADDLDALLDAYAVAPPGEALRARLLAAAPRPRPLAGWRRWFAGAGLGAGLAAACAAGVMVGGTLGGAGLDSGSLAVLTDATASDAGGLFDAAEDLS